jgi:hypothetical protein
MGQWALDSVHELIRWEYLRLRLTLKTNLASKRWRESQSWNRVYVLSGRGRSEEEIPGEDLELTNLLNELGSEGWELVSETVYESSAASSPTGWPNAQIPIDIRWTFKRSSP